MTTLTIPFSLAADHAAKFYADGPSGAESCMFLTTEFGVVDFRADGSASIDDDRHGFTIPADASKAYLIAAATIRSTYAAHGAAALECSFCGEDDRTVVVDAYASSADVSKLAALMEHARFDHSGPADIVAVVTSIVLRPADLGFDL